MGGGREWPSVEHEDHDALAKAREFHLTYTTNMSPCSNIIYTTSVIAEQKKIYKASNNSFQLLILSCVDSAFGIICNARTKDLKDGDVFLAWNNLCERNASQEMSNLVQSSTDYKLCMMENKTQTFGSTKWTLYKSTQNTRRKMVRLMHTFYIISLLSTAMLLLQWKECPL